MFWEAYWWAAAAWLTPSAGSPFHRNISDSGIGKALIKAALSTMPPECTVHVDTFVEGSPGAGAARRLYESCGFVPGDVWWEGEIVRQRYVRTPRMIDMNPEGASALVPFPRQAGRGLG